MRAGRVRECGCRAPGRVWTEWAIARFFVPALAVASSDFDLTGTVRFVIESPMNEPEIQTAYQRDGYVVVPSILDATQLDPIRAHIAARVDEYARDQYAQGKLSSTYADNSFTRRYAALCHEQGLDPRGWPFSTSGREFYELYNSPGILRVLDLILGPEVCNLGSPALRTKLPDSEVTSFPWHQDSQYVDQTAVGKKEQHTAHLHMVTVWVPLVEATVENGCCWVIPGSHRWGLLEGARSADHNVRMEEDVEAKGTPVAVPLEPGSALFMSNLCVHTSKLNSTNDCRWSIDFRYFPTPGSADLAPLQQSEAEFVRDKVLGGGGVPLVVLSTKGKPSWEQWQRQVQQQRASLGH